MVPVGGLDRRHKIRNARSILCNRHGNFAGSPGVAVTDNATIALVGDVPELDACLWEQIGNRHKGGTDDAKGMFDAVHLQDFDEGFFGCHLGHGEHSLVA